jgi:hypothetical protein
MNYARAFIFWIPLAVAITGLSGLIYVSSQQALRQGANDPQIEMAESGAAKLESGASVSSLLDAQTVFVNIATDLSPWIAAYDADGMPLAASSQLDNAEPSLPKGLFDTATWLPSKTFDSPSGKETRVTWQPRQGVRQAVVLVETENGDFVAAGRSLRLVEERESELTYEVGAMWGISMAASLFFALLAGFLLRRV